MELIVIENNDLRNQQDEINMYQSIRQANAAGERAERR